MLSEDLINMAAAVGLFAKLSDDEEFLARLESNLRGAAEDAKAMEAASSKPPCLVYVGIDWTGGEKDVH